MALNMKKALVFLQKDLEKNWGKISFSYTQEGKDEIKATASVNLNGFDDDIMLIINGYSGGGFTCRAVFDKIANTPAILALVNEFNDNNVFFKAIVREDGYLELNNFFICYDESVYKEYASEFLCRVVDLQEDETMKQLASFTE